MIKEGSAEGPAAGSQQARREHRPHPPGMDRTIDAIEGKLTPGHSSWRPEPPAQWWGERRQQDHGARPRAPASGRVTASGVGMMIREASAKKDEGPAWRGATGGLGYGWPPATRPVTGTGPVPPVPTPVPASLRRSAGRLGYGDGREPRRVCVNRRHAASGVTMPPARPRRGGEVTHKPVRRFAVVHDAREHGRRGGALREDSVCRRGAGGEGDVSGAGSHRPRQGHGGGRNRARQGSAVAGSAREPARNRRSVQGRLPAPRAPHVQAAMPDRLLAEADQDPSSSERPRWPSAWWPASSFPPPA